jgi:hypothetical protein
MPRPLAHSVASSDTFLSVFTTCTRNWEDPSPPSMILFECQQSQCYASNSNREYSTYSLPILEIFLLQAVRWSFNYDHHENVLWTFNDCSSSIIEE